MGNLEESELPENWVLIDSAVQGTFSDELRRELPSGHVLLGIDAVAIARREDRDDFLFIIEHPEYKYAQVHLTWSVETNPIWPSTNLFETVIDWKQEIIDDAW